jgi:Tat protein secretion system quality control protein TatD with DNase activity
MEECGVDASEGNNNIDRRTQIFDEQLSIANQKKLSVIRHCRGGQNMMELCLHSLKSILDKHHIIHWHCFDGNGHNYHNIKQEFPNTKFGISPFLLMDEQHPDFRTKVCEMDLQDIVMESDSPYIRPEGFQDVSPYLLKDIIWELASMFRTNGEEIAEITIRNARQLYGLMCCASVVQMYIQLNCPCGHLY